MTTPERPSGLRDELVGLLEQARDETRGTACMLRVDVPRHGIVERIATGAVERTTADAVPVPAEPSTPFRIASITKTFTAVVITQLATEGALAFDDLVTEHLPDELHDLVRRVHVIDGVSYGERLTLRHLLTHAGGLFDYASAPQFFAEIAQDPSRPWRPVDLLEGAVAWGTPHFAPGEGYGYAYSDTGYVLLGLIIEHRDGRSLHEAYRARILEPLGMRATYLEGYEPHRGPVMAHTYQGDIDTTPIHGTADWSGGGLVSDIDDLARFATALFAGELVPDRQLEVMLDHGFRTFDPTRHTPGYVGYGFGLDARESGGRIWRGHRGHWGALMHVDPLSGVVLTGAVNDAERRPDGLFHGVVATLDRHGLLAP
jgi:D-alanyl-D-alanine carboxypeptidase